MQISDLTPLIPLTQLGGVYLDNNPLSRESVDKTYSSAVRQGCGCVLHTAE